jgi:hypothetical protein
VSAKEDVDQPQCDQVAADVRPEPRPRQNNAGRVTENIVSIEHSCASRYALHQRHIDALIVLGVEDIGAHSHAPEAEVKAKQ